MRNNTQRQIFNSRTSLINQNKGAQKLKYYVKCPNCGFHLKDESSVNNYNRTHSSGNDCGTSRGSYGTYDNKTYLKTDKKSKSQVNNNTINTSNYRKHVEYNQKSSVQNSLRNL